MYRFRNYIVPLFLLLVFILPLVVKIGHDHDHFVCHAKHEKHFHEQHEKCAICKYEISLFPAGFIKPVITRYQHFVLRTLDEVTPVFAAAGVTTIRLRAPPH